MNYQHSTIDRRNLCSDSRNKVSTEDDDHSYGNDNRKSDESVSSEEDPYFKCTDLSQSDFNRLRIFYGSKLNSPRICLSSVKLFKTYDIDLVEHSVTNRSGKNSWESLAQGAVILQVHYDKELPEEVCGATIIVTNPENCEQLWSSKLYSLSKYRIIDDHFQVLIMFKKDNLLRFDDPKILRDYAIGMYFSNLKASKQFNEFVSDYLKRVIVSESRDLSSRNEVIQKYNDTKRQQKKSNPIRKSTISPPIMFNHTIHTKK